MLKMRWNFIKFLGNEFEKLLGAVLRRLTVKKFFVVSKKICAIDSCQII